MTQPTDVLPMRDCKCSHRFLEHQLDGRRQLANACTHAGCGCDYYRPKTVND